jgi:[ribosomal protein S5]-alanine N-acetyltransferase
MKFETITTERLVLRKLGPEDFQHLFENASESEIKYILGLNDDEDYLKDKERFLGSSGYNRSFVFFQILERENMNVIGSCGFHNWHPLHLRSEMGYILKYDQYKNKGIMTETIPPILEYGFSRMKLNRIEAQVGPENIPSLRLLKKFGFQQEGILRKHYVVDKVAEDSLIFSLLKEEYLNRT